MQFLYCFAVCDFGLDMPFDPCLLSVSSMQLGLHKRSVLLVFFVVSSESDKQ